MKHLYLIILCLSILTITNCSITLKKCNQGSQIVKFTIDTINAKIDQKNRIITLSGRDLNLRQTPLIEVSNNGKVSPQSGEPVNFTSPVEYTVTSPNKKTITYTVFVSSTVKPFFIGKKKYAIITEAMTWEKAAEFAKERGGYLAQINHEDEQKGIYNAAVAYNIDFSQTIAPDGGGASYLWLGGTDKNKEGYWVWDGKNEGNETPFWQGKKDGQPIESRYSNWGQEPDDYLDNQDALGLALTNWPLGKTSQWNDIAKTNKLFFVIEF